MARKDTKSNKPSYTPGVEFNDSDKLFLFVQKMKELRGRSFYKKLTLEVDKELKEIRLFRIDDQESFDAFILTFRHFWEPSSPIEANKVAAIFKRAAKLLKDSSGAGLLETLADIDREFETSTQFGITLPNDGKSKILGDYHVFDLYMNCKYFHLDDRGAALFYALPEEKLKEIEMVFQGQLVRLMARLDRYFAVAVNLLRLQVLPIGVFRVNFRLPNEERPEGFTRSERL